MKFVPVDNVTCISILFYLHYFSNNVNKSNHILEQILLRFQKHIRRKTLFIIVLLLRYNTNLMQVMYYKVVCATNNSVILTIKTFVIFTIFFLNLFLWDCQLFGKKILKKLDALIPIVVFAHTTTYYFNFSILPLILYSIALYLPHTTI